MMKKNTITEKTIIKYMRYLQEEERSEATIEKYQRDILKFYEFLPQPKMIDKENVIAYKVSLMKRYKPTSINSMLVALNGFLSFLGLNEFKVKLHKLQKKVFADQSRELSKQEYMRLLACAKDRNDDRLYMLIQAMCATGIRVSEHKEITVEALQKGKAVINNKGKVREIYFDKKLRTLLLAYCKRNQIKRGSVFITKTGEPLDRSNIWKMMENLCRNVNVDQEKVFPHNLRHLFAFTYYQLEKDLVQLAGILGHSSIETTRMYTMSKGVDCIKSISKLGLLAISIE